MSSAYPEFSDWSEERNRLKVETVRALLLVKKNVKLLCKDFFKYILNSTKLLKKLRSATKYLSLIQYQYMRELIVGLKFCCRSHQNKIV